jgi:hypothetical protein
MVLGVAGLVVVSSRRKSVAVPAPVALTKPPQSLPRLPAPRLRESTAPDPEPIPQESRIRKLLNGEELAEIRLADLEGYLAANRRNSSSLLAAFRLTGDRELLREAAERFPNDPRVAWESWFRTQDPAEKLKWFGVWAQAEPNNSLASYLAAASLMKEGKTDTAVEQLQAAAGKTEFSYFARESIVDCEEAYKAAGYSDAEAKMAATMGLLLPHLAELKRMSQGMADLASAYRQAGDDSSAQAVLNIGFQLVQRISSDKSWMIEDLVGLAIENNLLKVMDPASPSGVPGKTVQDLMAELASRRDTLKAAGKDSEGMLKQLSDADLAAFCDRLKLFGERQANAWLREKFGPVGGPAAGGQ